ncbi:YidC/Oxa1 family membrane protein insertase [Alkaliphilus transvaalensis]|uniref:YidC/Oxa1 family membrane protein insertase n=1 Tax=Alkaliphilus transvaalensis TaxID=114628 RepID=UPI00047EBBE7|nr:YidC/Oxa1 family membrane protein insertase [Alkaliphilus transvaalensis]
MQALARPLGMLLKFIYDLINNYGLSIIVFTIVVKLILVPLTLKQMKSMKELQEIQPKIKEIQEKYKNDKEKLNVKTMELYQEHKISPFGGCLPMLIQLPILFGLFAVLRDPGLYVFGSQEVYESINTSFLWLPNLTDADKLILPLIAGLTTFLTSATTPSANKGDQTQKMMMYFFPVMIFWWGRSFPAGLTLYWVVSNSFQVVQQLVLARPKAKTKEGV